jgi:hypothetical protein
MIEYRARQSLSDEALKPMWGKILTDDERSITVTGPARMLKPNGDLLAVYLPGAIPKELRESSYGTLHELRKIQTNNRGLASGMERFGAPGKRTATAPISSAIVGAFDPVGPYQYCRLTAFTRDEGEKYSGLFPLFRNIAEHFAANVPDRFKVQLREAEQAKPEWVVPGTPFTTITVNNTYPTGVHVDKGDLGDGFSCLAALRRGNYSGGILTFPKFRIGVDMKDGDVLLMDAHEAHGNTHLYCFECRAGDDHPMRGMCDEHGTERISIVTYFRTKIKACGTLEEEQVRRVASAEKGMAEGDAQDEALLLNSAVVSKVG